MESSPDSEKTNIDQSEIVVNAKVSFYSKETSPALDEENAPSSEDTIIVSETSSDLTTSLSGNSVTNCTVPSLSVANSDSCDGQTQIECIIDKTEILPELKVQTLDNEAASSVENCNEVKEKSTVEDTSHVEEFSSPASPIYEKDGDTCNLDKDHGESSDEEVETSSLPKFHSSDLPDNQTADCKCNKSKSFVKRNVGDSCNCNCLPSEESLDDPDDDSIKQECLAILEKNVLKIDENVDKVPSFTESSGKVTGMGKNQVVISSDEEDTEESNLIEVMSSDDDDVEVVVINNDNRKQPRRNRTSSPTSSSEMKRSNVYNHAIMHCSSLENRSSISVSSSVDMFAYNQTNFEDTLCIANSMVPNPGNDNHGFYQNFSHMSHFDISNISCTNICSHRKLCNEKSDDKHIPSESSNHSYLNQTEYPSDNGHHISFLRDKMNKGCVPENPIDVDKDDGLDTFEIPAIDPDGIDYNTPVNAANPDDEGIDEGQGNAAGESSDKNVEILIELMEDNRSRSADDEYLTKLEHSSKVGKGKECSEKHQADDDDDDKSGSNGQLEDINIIIDIMDKGNDSSSVSSDEPCIDESKESASNVLSQEVSGGEISSIKHDNFEFIKKGVSSFDDEQNQLSSNKDKWKRTSTSVENMEDTSISKSLDSGNAKNNQRCVNEKNIVKSHEQTSEALEKNLIGPQTCPSRSTKKNIIGPQAYPPGSVIIESQAYSETFEQNIIGPQAYPPGSVDKNIIESRAYSFETVERNIIGPQAYPSAVNSAGFVQNISAKQKVGGCDDIDIAKKKKRKRKKHEYNAHSVAVCLNAFNELLAPAKKSCAENSVDVDSSSFVSNTVENNTNDASPESAKEVSIIPNSLSDPTNIREGKKVSNSEQKLQTCFEDGSASEMNDICDGTVVDTAITKENLEISSLQIPEYTHLQNPQQIGASFQEFKSKPENHLRGCLWSPDGSCILTNSDDNILRIFKIPQEMMDNTSTQELVADLKMSEGETVYDIDWYPFMDIQSPDTCCFLSTSRDHPIHLWDSYGGALRCTYRAHNQLDELASAHCVSFNADGSKIYCGFDKCIRIFDSSRPGNECIERCTDGKKNRPRKGKPKRMLSQPGIISSIAFSGYSSLYALGSFSRTVGLYDTNDGKAVSVMNGHTGGVTQVKFTSDGYYLISGARKDCDIIWWDLRNTTLPLFKLLRNVSTNQRIQFDIDRGNLNVFSGSTDNVVNIWNLKELPDEIQDDVISYEPTYKFRAHDDAVNAVCLHPTKPLLATTSGQRHFYDDSDSDSAGLESTLPQFDNSLKIWKL